VRLFLAEAKRTSPHYPLYLSAILFDLFGGPVRKDMMKVPVHPEVLQATKM